MSVRFGRRHFLVLLAGAGAAAATPVLRGTPADAATTPTPLLQLVPAPPVRHGRRMVLQVRTGPRRRLSILDSSGARWQLDSDDGSVAVFSRWA